MITDGRPYVSELFQHLEAKGRAEGKAEAVLQVLGFRGVEVSEEVREQIVACRDIEQLGVWLERAFHADPGEAFTP